MGNNCVKKHEEKYEYSSNPKDKKGYEYRTTFREDGTKEYEAEYINGVQNGKIKKYSKSGKLICETTGKNMKVNGSYTEWDENGNLICEGFYLDHNSYGEFKVYIDQQICLQIAKNGIWEKETVFDKNGNKTGEKFRIENTNEYQGYNYFPDGQKVRCKFYLKNDKLHDEYQLFDDNGDIIVKIFFCEGIIRKFWPLDLEVNPELLDIAELEEGIELKDYHIINSNFESIKNITPVDTTFICYNSYTDEIYSVKNSTIKCNLHSKNEE